MKLPSRKVLLIAGAVVALGVISLLVRDGGPPVTTATVVRDSLTVSIAVEGRTRARDVYTLTAPVGGRLDRLQVERGDTVEAGAVLARLHPAPEDPRTVATLRADVEAAEATRGEATTRVAQAGAREAQARREVERRRPLADMGAFSREAMEQVELAAEVAERELDAARSALTAAEAGVRRARTRLIGTAGEGDAGPVIDLRAPTGGRVVMVPDRSARVVPPGATLLELADTDGIELVIDVLSEEAVDIEPGSAVLITEWGGMHSLRGSVRTVTRAGYTEISALGVEEQRVDVIADLERVPPSLGTGYRVSGEIAVWRGDDVLVVPSSAVFSATDGWRVFVVEGGRAWLRRIEIGRSGPDRTHVTRGLEEGERVITFPGAELEDGGRVRAEPDPSPVPAPSGGTAP